MPRILVIRLSSMGDVIHALPAAASLKSSFPHSHLAWVIRPRWAPLLEGNPFVDEIIPFDRGTSEGLRLAWRSLRARRFDLAVDFQGLVQSALVAAVARPDRLAGFHRSEVRERPAAWFYSTEVAPRSAHVVDRNLELAAAAGAFNLVRVFPIPAGAPDGDLPAGRFVLASPAAGWAAKEWPREYYESLASKLHVPLVVNGPPSAAESLKKIRGAHVHLSTLAGLIDATRRAAAVVGVDSGPLHLAAALGKPGVAVYGPTDPSRNGPYGPSIAVLRDPAANTSYKRHAQTDLSMRAITPAAVLDLLHAALASRPAGCSA